MIGWAFLLNRLKVVGHKPSRQPGRVIVVANHLSNADAFFLSSALAPWETKYIAKASLFNVGEPTMIGIPCSRL